MTKILIEPHYIGSLEYFNLLLSATEVIFETHQHFTKQTYKNRCRILTANGVKSLVIPVRYNNRTAYKEVTVDYNQSWVKEHWGALYSSYGKAPFFEYFADYFHRGWEYKHKYLLDLNQEMLTICLNALQKKISFTLTDRFELEPDNGIQDYREHILAKKSFEERRLYNSISYTQTFGNKFEPNLSLLDLIMNEGPGAFNVLQQSAGAEIEQKSF